MNLSSVRRIRDPQRRAAAAADLLRQREAAVKTEIAKIRKARDDAARSMLSARGEEGQFMYRPADVARTLGISRASVSERFPHSRDR